MSSALRQIEKDEIGKPTVPMREFLESLVHDATETEKSWEEFWDDQFGEHIVSPNDFPDAMNWLWDRLRSGTAE
jgi:hypothetical protein